MIHATICQLTGSLILNKEVVSRDLIYSDFKVRFADKCDLIFGNSGNAKYSLRETIELFSSEFRVCFYFKDEKLRSYVLYLISGPVANRVEEYPEDDVLQKELAYLEDIFRRSLSGEKVIEYVWRHSWRYAWGEITLMEQVQDSSVLTNVSWKQDIS